MKWDQVKLLFGVIGASAVVVMGVLTMAFAGAPNGTDNIHVVSDEMTTGETITEATAPSEPESTFVEPPVTATPPDGFGPPLTHSSLAVAIARAA